MIVYGDPQYEASLALLRARLQDRLTALQRNDQRDGPSLDALRVLLIHAGQLEQAVCDGAENLLPEALRDALTGSQTVTDGAAAAFLARWDAGRDDVSPQAEVRDILTATARALDGMPESSVPLTVKVPEGFAFYTLYPEQYCAAALQWAQDHAEAEPPCAVVVGIRSIGTSLSALVAATLRHAGWQVSRLTVRPRGHPFDRTAAIAADQMGNAAWGLVVDEGPGLSGSSMAAAAWALQGVGIARDRIAFFPGHANDPGSAASDEIRTWWRGTPRYVAPPDTLRWSGRSLIAALADRTVQLCSADTTVQRIEDLSGGQWRHAIYADPAQWPAVAAPFERTKYRCTLGSGEAVLWKFAGLATVSPEEGSVAETMHDRLGVRAASGWTPAPLGTAYGFLALPWINGTPLTRTDRTPRLLRHIGRYIAAVAGPTFSLQGRQEAVTRLDEMLFVNIGEAFGESAAERAREWSRIAMQWSREADVPSYGDGRMAPCEWLRDRNGRILKVDDIGHDCDHTVVGKQPYVWDVAGAMVEWDLDGASAAPLLSALRDSGCEDIPVEVLHFYRLAYAAFRLGMYTLCASFHGDDPEERARLQSAMRFYRTALEAL